jgi:membrane protease YdiL (CAAX protease family)
MGILSWVIFPAVSPDFRSDPLGAGVARSGLLTVGVAWQFVLCLVIVRREAGDLRWATVKRRLRLTAPRDPATGERRARLWLWALPFVIALVVWETAVAPSVNGLWDSVVPALAEPPGYSFGAVLQPPDVLARLAGAWWFFGLFVVLAVFNSMLGEELLFRGVLLPRMGGVFGRWSWVANGVLFSLHHVHPPWSLVSNVLSDALLLAFPCWQFCTTWMGVIVHAVQIVLFAFLILGVVLGLA